MASDNSVQVLRKASAVLDVLAREGEVTAADLAKRIDEPRTTVYRLLSSLQELDLVEAGGRRGTFRLGLRLLRLGSAVISRFDERQAALPVMEEIHRSTGETVFLCVRRDYEAVCIERLDGKRVQSLALRLGGSLPLHAGAAPRALLAFEPPAFWDGFIASGPLEQLTPSTPITKKALISELKASVKRGYAISDGDVTVGIAAIGAPVFDHAGVLRAALSVSGIRAQILEDDGAVIHLVVAGADEISRSLGYDNRKELSRA